MQLFLLLPPSTSFLIKASGGSKLEKLQGGEKDLEGEAIADTNEGNALLGTPVKLTSLLMSLAYSSLPMSWRGKCLGGMS